MGADLILGWVKWPVTTDGNFPPPSNALADVMRSRVAALSDETLRYIGEQFCIDEETSDDPASDIRDQLLTAVTSHFADQDNRDTMLTQMEFTEGIRHPYYLITGGMSWGDNPTDSLDEMTMLAMSGITVEPVPEELAQ